MYITTSAAEIPSMDSWDLENINYMNKMKKNKIEREKDVPVVPDESITVYDNVISITTSDCNDFNMGCSSSKDNMKSFHQVLYPSCFKNINKFETVYSNADYISFPVNDTPWPILTSLENCCHLDVVTVRNESIIPSSMATNFSSQSTLKKIEKSYNFDSECHTHNNNNLSTIDYNFNVGHTEDESIVEIKKIESYDDDDDDMSYQIGKENCIQIEPNNLTGGSQITLPRFNTGKFIDYFYFGQNTEINDASIVPTVGDDECPPEMSMRTPSPYYVRLRRDVIPPKYKTSSSVIRHPQNFGMDTNGQLLIDYSSNWDNLEKYVGNLIGC